MIHARKDYNRIQDPALDDRNLLGRGCTPIGEDEPVMLFRAQDRLFKKVLDHYRTLLEIAGKSDMAALVTEHIVRATEWEKWHETKTPDVPEER